MSEMSKQSRAAMRAKATRLAGGDPQRKVDASSWLPTEPLDTTAKTGARPIRPRIYKAGGAVQGDRGPRRADCKPRATGGRTTAEENVDAKVNRDVVKANADKFGKPHEGAFRKGGAARKKRDMGGGMQDPRAQAQGALEAAGQRSGTSPNRMGFGNASSGVSKLIGLKKGGAAESCKGGGRTERKAGGRTKGKTNINIVIAQPHGQQPQQPQNMAPVRPPPPQMPPPPPQMPPMGAPPGGPGGPPMPPPSMAGGPGGGMPMMPRKRGGRTMMHAGAGSGAGRLEKIELQKGSQG